MRSRKTPSHDAALAQVCGQIRHTDRWAQVASRCRTAFSHNDPSRPKPGGNDP